MSIQYKAVVPTVGKTDKDNNLVTQYNKKTCGVRFNDGVAFFTDLTMDKHLGLTAEQAARSMVKDFGYQVFIVTDQGEVPFDPVAPIEAVARQQAAAIERSAAIASAKGKGRARARA